MKGINRRLTILALLIVGMIGLLSYLYETTQHERMHEEIARDVIESTRGPKALLKKFIIKKMTEGDQRALREELQIFQGLGLLEHICIYDSSGNIWLSAGGSSEPLPLFNDENLVCSSCHSFKPAHLNNHTDNFVFALKNNTMCHECHGGEKDVIGYVYARLRLPGTDMIESMSRKKYIFIYFVIGGIVLFLGGWYIHYYIVRRLKDINRAIKTFEEIKWEPLVDKHNDEIAEIAHSFNRMADRILSIQFELNESRLYMKNLLDNMTDMVVVLDREHRIRYVNRATLEYLGREESEVLGKKCYGIFHKCKVPCYMSSGPEKDECGFLPAFGGKRFSAVHTHRTEKGEVYIHVQYIPFYQDGKISYIIEMARDITETYKLNEEKRVLSAYNEALQDVRNMSHLVERLVRLGKEELGADSCNMFIYDHTTGRLRLSNKDTVDPVLREHISEMGLDECVSIHAIESGKPFVAESPDEFPESRLKSVLIDAGIKEIVSIPIREEGRVVGVYNLAYREAFRFRKEDIEFFSLLMDSINRVYQRVRHYEEIREHGERLSTIIEVVNAINKTVDYNDVLHRLTQSVKRILDSHISGVLLYDKKGKLLHVASIHGVEIPQQGQNTMTVDSFDIEVSREESSFSCINIFREERWRPLYNIARIYGFKAFYARVLFSRKNEKMGILFSLWRDEYLPSLEDIAYFSIFSEHAELVMEKAMLYAEIEKQKNNWEDTFNSFSDPLFITDSSFNLIRCNKAFYEFVGKDDVLGKKCYEVVHGSERPFKDCPHFETMLQGKTIIKEFYDSERGRHYVYTTSLIKYTDGESRVVHHIKDISFLKRLEQEYDSLLHQLVQAQKMEAVGNLAGGIAHDFNNILTGILGHAELAEMKLKDDNPIRENLFVIKRAAERARDFTRQLLLFGRKTPLEKRVQDINSILKESLKLINRLIGEDIELEYIPAKDTLFVDVDAAQITQVIMNLVVNARDAMPDGGRLTIKTERRVNENKEKYAVIIVKDTGAGIPEEIRESIFEPFFTTKPEGKGSGLGLSVVYSVVDRHGGFIDVKSRIGEGTTFEIHLPEVDIREKHTIHIREDEDIPGGNEAILLVDDEELIRDTGRIILENLGYRVCTAANGKEAIEIFKRDPDGFDLILSDLIMPEMRGTELYEKVAELRPDMKFVLITGYGKHLIEPDLKYRIKAFIEKPFNIKDVARRLRDVLDGRV